MPASPCDAGEDFDNILNALDRTEVREVNEEPLVGFSEARTHGGDYSGLRTYTSQLTKLRMTSISEVDVEGFAGAVAQIGGDGGDAVRLLDAELCDGQIGAVEAYQCNVGAVQCGDEGEMDAAVASICRASSALTECGMA